MPNIRLSETFNQELNMKVNKIVFTEYIKRCINKTITKEIIKNNTRYGK